MKSADRLFLDTVDIQALLNKSDQHYDAALNLLPRVEAAREIIVTDAITTDHHFEQAGFRTLMKN